MVGATWKHRETLSTTDPRLRPLQDFQGSRGPVGNQQPVVRTPPRAGQRGSKGASIRRVLQERSLKLTSSKIQAFGSFKLLQRKSVRDNAAFAKMTYE